MLAAMSRPDPSPAPPALPHLIALVGDDRATAAALADAARGSAFALHPVPADRVAERLAALETLDFAGAIVLSFDAAARAASAGERRSLDANDAKAADTFTVSPSGLLADLTLGPAVGGWLRSERWDGAGARVAIIGEGWVARAIARELASMGAAEIAVLGSDRPSAEASLPDLAASSRGAASALDSGQAEAHLRHADLVVRLRAAPLPEACFGPHLTLLDLAGEALGRLRARAIRTGATTANRADLDAYRVAEAVRRILGAPVDPTVFLDVLHDAYGTSDVVDPSDPTRRAG